MTARLAALIVASGFTLLAAEARAQCGDTSKDHQMSQNGTQRSVWVSVETGRSGGGLCFFVGAVQSEGWVNESPHAAPAPVRQEGNNVTAALSFTQDVPDWGNWQSYGKHWHIYPASGTWYDLGETQKWAEVNAPADDEECDADVEQACDEQCGLWDEPTCTCEWTGGCGESPIVIDMAGNGYYLTDAEHGVLFDLDGDGAASLVLESPNYGGGRADRLIDANDAAWSRLLLWTDRNHNGFSETDELRPITTTALKVIDTNYALSRRRDQYGNEFRLRGKGFWADGTGRLTARFIYDVWLAQQ